MNLEKARKLINLAPNYKDYPRKAEDGKNCYFCAKFIFCPLEIKKKGLSGLCGNFIASDDVSSFIEEPEKVKIKQDFSFDVERRDQQSLKDMVKEVLTKGFWSVSNIDKIDDRDFPLAKNYWDFTENFITDFYPYPKQLEIGIGSFQEYCPRCSNKDFIDNYPNGDYVNDKQAAYQAILDNVVLLEHCICPKCKISKLELVKNGELKDYIEVAGISGQRSGKSAHVSSAAAYNQHRFIKFPKLLEAFNLAPNSPITATYIALTLHQAKTNLWEPMESLIYNQSPWFQGYHDMLAYYSTKYGEEYFIRRDTYRSYAHKNMLIYVGVPNRSTLRGYTRFDGAIDELDWFNFNSQEEKSQVKVDAKQVHAAMANSFRDFRSGVRNLRNKGQNLIPVPMLTNVSSTSGYNGFLTSRYRTSQDVANKLIYGFKYATWEFNPKISQEELIQEFIHDKETLYRDFGSVPSISRKSFFNSLDILKIAIGSYPNAANIISKKIQIMDTLEQTSAELNFNWHNETIPKIMALDPGSSSNSFAISIAHLQKNGDKYHIVVDVLGEIIPFYDASINYSRIFDEVLLPLVKKYKVTTIISDRWQNIKMMQDLQKSAGHPVQLIEYRVRYSDFENFRQLIFDKAITLPKEDFNYSLDNLKIVSEVNYPHGFTKFPVAHWLWQCLTVVDYTGKTVDKGDNSTDDIFRTTVLLNAFFSKLKEDEIEIYYGTISSIKGKGLKAAFAPNGKTNLVPGIAVKNSGSGSGSGSGRTFARKI